MNINKHTLYYVWEKMRDRCNNKNAHNYKNYGGRGIKVCERWNSFARFVNDMGERPEDTTLDRINNDGNYEPGNCRWATRKQQSRNMSRNRNLTHDGLTMCVEDWAPHIGIKENALRIRLKRWQVATALSLPPHYCASKHIQPSRGEQTKGEHDGTVS